MLNKGIIVSIQGYSQPTTEELSYFAFKGGAVAIRTDKDISNRERTIGLSKKDTPYRRVEAYITVNINDVNKVAAWADYVAIDYRRCNYGLEEVQQYCKDHNIKVVADIGEIEDVDYIMGKGYYFTYLSTTFNVFFKQEHNALLCQIIKKYPELDVIAEGGYTDPDDAGAAMILGANNVCIGGAISDIEKLTKRYVEYAE